MPQSCLTEQQSKLWLIHVKLLSPLYSPVSFNILREICEYLSAFVLVPCLSNSTLTVFNAATRTSTTVHLSSTFSLGTVFCFLSPRSLLCVGDYEPSTTVRMLDVVSGSVCNLSQMSTCRGWPGIARLSNCVYVFGGNTDPPLLSCEKFSIETQAWQPIADMWSGKVACPIMYMSKFEVFTPETETFRELLVSYTMQFYGSVAFFNEDTMLVVTFGKKLLSWQVDSAELKEEDIEIEDEKGALSNIPPLRVGNSVFWVNYASGDLIEFDLERNALVQNRKEKRITKY